MRLGAGHLPKGTRKRHIFFIDPDSDGISEDVKEKRLGYSEYSTGIEKCFKDNKIDSSIINESGSYEYFWVVKVFKWVNNEFILSGIKVLD